MVFTFCKNLFLQTTTDTWHADMFKGVSFNIFMGYHIKNYIVHLLNGYLAQSEIQSGIYV